MQQLKGLEAAEHGGEVEEPTFGAAGRCAGGAGYFRCGGLCLGPGGSGLDLCLVGQRVRCYILAKGVLGNLNIYLDR